jgi:glycosyltransferase involved in cell wall biosynthesis
LDSVYAQSLKPVQVVVIDDGSIDNTRELVATRFPHADYVYQQHRGVSHARNSGIRRARCAWLAFLDSDDEWLPWKLQRQVDALRVQPDYRICHTNEIWIRKGKRVNPMKKHEKAGGWIFERCLPLCVISPSSVLIHRTVLESVGVFDETLPACEDYDLWLRICAHYPVLYVRQPLINKYGGHADQLSRRHWGMDRFRVQALERLRKEANLPFNELQATLNTLVHKVGIVLAGARRRGNHGLVAEYEDKLDCYRNELRGLQTVSSLG